MGGTGQAKAVRPIIERDRHSMVVAHDRNPSGGPFGRIRLIRDNHRPTTFLGRYAAAELGFPVAIGGQIATDHIDTGGSFCQPGFEPLTLIRERPWAGVSPNAE